MSWLCACATAVSVASTVSGPHPALARSALVSVTTCVVTPPGAGAAVLGAGDPGGFGVVRVGAGAGMVGRGGAFWRVRDADGAGCSRPADGMITSRRERSADPAVDRSAAARSAADGSAAD